MLDDSRIDSTVLDGALDTSVTEVSEAEAEHSMRCLGDHSTHAGATGASNAGALGAESIEIADADEEVGGTLMGDGVGTEREHVVAGLPALPPGSSLVGHAREQQSGACVCVCVCVRVRVCVCV